MNRRVFTPAEGGRKPGELVRLVADELIARGLGVRRKPGSTSRLLGVETPEPGRSPYDEIQIRDDGYVELRYWPPQGHVIDVGAVTDLVVDFLSRKLSTEPEERT